MVVVDIAMILGLLVEAQSTDTSKTDVIRPALEISSLLTFWKISPSSKSLVLTLI
jgi:hypothetical protein